MVHRHAVPDLAKVSWAFVDAYISSTLGELTNQAWERIAPLLPAVTGRPARA